MESKTRSASIRLPLGVDDPCYYGFRWVRRVDSETGKEVLQQKPLSPQDFLDPQEGDRFPQAPIHETDTTDATSIFRYLYRDNSTIGSSGICSKHDANSSDETSLSRG